MNRYKKIFTVLGVGLAVLLAWFAYYAISPLFRHIKADDALPQTSKAQAPVVVAQSDVVPTASQSAQTPATSPAVTSAQVVGTGGHPASGTVRVVEGNGKRYVRYENFKTLNGPDIYVYLAKDLDAKEFVSLGQVRATEGNVNYEIPAGVDR